MEWEYRLCPERACDEVWYVASDGRGYHVWYVAREPEACPTVVAAMDPVCPKCGTTLVTVLELEGGYGHLETLEVGKVFDYVRSL
ncbi:MAG TPA: hypothetical protein VNL77_02445 [Roseiflexaceae bacterium]|nr:hypothetical protein [Roseiflexaceae bacterium]